MKRKTRKLARKRNAKKVLAFRANSRRKRATKKRSTHTRIRRRLLIPKNRRRTEVQRKALAALAHMRREKMSLAKATRLEHIKQSTFHRYVGSAVYQSGPGKPWKVAKSDRLSAKMTILTAQGPTFAMVRGSVERTRLARYDIVVRKVRAGEDGAVVELQVFKGQTVAGLPLITDPALLIQLEEAGQLDFDALYYSAGARL
jgi:hypothetical protein